MLVALGTPNHVIPPRSLIEFLKLSWTCASRLPRNKTKFPVSLTIALKVFSDQSRQSSVSAQAFFWKCTSASFYQDAFSTAFNLFPFPRKIIASFGCFPVGQKQAFKVQKGLLFALFGCEVHTFLFRLSFDLLSICSYAFDVSPAKGRGDSTTLKRCRGRYLPRIV